MSSARRATVIRRISLLALLLSVVFATSLALIETAESGMPARHQEQAWDSTEKGLSSAHQKRRTPHVTVDGLGISEDIAQATEEDPEFYLRHDIEGNPSYKGAAFFDYRCSTTSRHAIIYGHNLSGSDKMFSPLRTAWEQRTFQKIKSAELTTSTGKTIALEPLCACRIDASNQEIQCFDFHSDSDFSSWLRQIVSHAEIKSPKTKRLAHRAVSCVSLITCASVRPHQKERTLVIFVPTHRRPTDASSI